jgi:hypothetical protein
MSHKDKVITIGALLTVVALGLLQWRAMARGQQRSEEEIRRFVEGLPLGIESSAVEEAFRNGGYSQFQLARAEPNHLLVKGPLSLGAKNWFVFLEFAGERLACVKYRTEDSVYERPARAPSDRCPPSNVAK